VFNHHFITAHDAVKLKVVAEGVMANILSREKQVRIISALAEDAGLRAIKRMTGTHRDTIDAGHPCWPRLLPYPR